VALAEPVTITCDGQDRLVRLIGQLLKILEKFGR